MQDLRRRKGTVMKRLLILCGAALYAVTPISSVIGEEHEDDWDYRVAVELELACPSDDLLEWFLERTPKYHYCSLVEYQKITIIQTTCRNMVYDIVEYDSFVEIEVCRATLEGHFISVVLNTGALDLDVFQDSFPEGLQSGAPYDRYEENPVSPTIEIATTRPIE